MTATDERLALYAGILAECYERSRGVTCPECDVTGIPGVLCDGAGGSRRRCPACKGTGKIPTPPDNSPRLVFADWLEENGEPERAEFIRVQVEIAKLAIASGHPKTTPLAWSCKCDVCDAAKPLRRRERELIQQMSGERLGMSGWILSIGPERETYLMPPKKNRGMPVTFRRGFVERIECPADFWLKHADALCWRRGVTCRECSGKGGHWRCPNCHGEWRGDVGPDCFVCGHPRLDRHDCPACRGSKCRPMPQAAQPIESVKLSSFPTSHVPDFNRLRDWRKPVEWGGDIGDSIRAEWPWIQFWLPNEIRPENWNLPGYNP